MGKVHNFQPFPRGPWGIKSSSKTQLADFSTMLSKMAISKLLSCDFGEK